MRSFVLLVTLCLTTPVFGALPGVTELKTTPENLTDAALSTLLRPRVESAAVTAIGETVHGSAGFLRLQTRLIRYLVESHGLRLLVWENPVLRSMELSRWVAACTRAATPPPLDVLYMPTAADRALWDWVCEFNRSRSSDPIVFRGMDVWDRPWEHYARVRTLGSSLAVDATLLKSIDATCPAVRSSSWPEIEAIFEEVRLQGKFLPAEGYERCRDALTALLNTSRRSGAAKSQPHAPHADAAFELALSASTLLGWLGFYNYQWSHDVLGWNERDRAQGRNLMLLMEKHGAKRAILSAHSSHVSHGRSPADWWGYGDLKSGAHFFAAMTGKRVFSMALTAYDASGTQGHWSLPVAKSSLDKRLHDAGHRFSFFTASAAFLAEHGKWWMQNQNFPGPYESGVEIVPADHFDAYFYLDETHLDKALPARPMWQP